MYQINDEKLIVKPLDEIGPASCHNCGETATHQVLVEQGKEKYSCTKQICLAPLVFPQSQ